MKLAASGSCPLRQWDVIRKKWHDFASAAKARGAAVRRDRERTGGGPSSVPALSRDEERALAILGEAASQGISGGIDLRAGVDTLPQSTSCLPPRPNTPSSPASSDSASSAPASPHLSAPSLPLTEVAQQQQSGSRRRPLIRCNCSDELVKLEKEKLQLLRGNEQGLQEANDIARATLEVEKAKVHIMEKQYALSEAQFQRPSISVPIILPDQGKVL